MPGSAANRRLAAQAGTEGQVVGEARRLLARRQRQRRIAEPGLAAGHAGVGRRPALHPDQHVVGQDRAIRHVGAVADKTAVVLVNRARETPLVHALYTRPFIDLVERLDDDGLAQSILATANNPYWVVKAMARHDGLLERLIAP